MKKKIVALALCMMLMTNAVYADKLTELNNEKKAKTSDLNESKSNLNKLKDNKDAEMEKLKNINLKLTQTQSELAIQQQELEKINKSIDDTKKEIEKWLDKFLWRFFSQQFKRSALPDGPKVGSISLSPRGDFRMPSDASVNSFR